MTEFTFRCVIDGQDYSLQQLADVRYLRDLHILHTMKRAGATIAFGGKTLSDDDIDALDAEGARAASVAARESYDPDGIRHLFRDQLRASETMWRELNAASEGLPLQSCLADITITGISYEVFSANMAAQTPFLEHYPDIHPDHYFVERTDEGIRGVETFGMYGGPSEVRLTPSRDLVVPIPRDESYPFAFGGIATLPDGTDINAPAYMQMKPLDNGVALLAGCCFPAKAPKEMVQGHKLHLAMEFLGFARWTAAAGDSLPAPAH